MRQDNLLIYGYSRALSRNAFATNTCLHGPRVSLCFANQKQVHANAEASSSSFTVYVLEPERTVNSSLCPSRGVTALPAKSSSALPRRALSLPTPFGSSGSGR